jgi:hypothetical protein
MTCFAAFFCPSWFRILLNVDPKFEKTRSIAAEHDGKRSNFSAAMIKNGDALHWELRMDVHHITLNVNINRI